MVLFSGQGQTHFKQPMYTIHHKQASYYSGSQDNVDGDSVNDDSTSSNDDERTHENKIDKRRELFDMSSTLACDHQGATRTRQDAPFAS